MAGNMDESDAEQLRIVVQKSIQLKNSEMLKNDDISTFVMKIKDGETYEWDCLH